MTRESEATTRQQRIDPKLRAAGWPVRPYRVDMAWPTRLDVAYEEWPTTAGPADYALASDETIRAVVEAKKLTVGPPGVLTQAERYSRGIDQAPWYQGEFGVPFLYSTNGERIFFHDARHELNRSREVTGFHTPDALREMLARDFDRELSRLGSVPQNERMRGYQVEASRAVEEAIAQRKRKMLLTMATGTGKTMTTVNEIYRLMKSGVARRVLFLVDRQGPGRADRACVQEL